MSQSTPTEVGRRVAVWGVTGSGKTTLAKELGVALGLPVVELDAIRHSHGWDSTDWPEFSAILTETLDRHAEGWIVEGSYSRIMDAYMPRIDTMVWLHLPFRTSFWRLLFRTVTRGWSRSRLYTPTGPNESLRLSFLDRRSILWWSISTHRRSTRQRKERIAALPPHVRVHELRTPREVEAFLSAVRAARPSRAAGTTGGTGAAAGS